MEKMLPDGITVVDTLEEANQAIKSLIENDIERNKVLTSVIDMS